jgi:hypothetical protein
VVEWLAVHPGPYHYRAVADALGADAGAIIKTLSSAKKQGAPVNNDGKGQWYHTGPRLVGANSHGPAFGPGPGPSSDEAGPEVVFDLPPGPPQFRRMGPGEYRKVDGFILLEDADGNIWLAEKIR